MQLTAESHAECIQKQRFEGTFWRLGSLRAVTKCLYELEWELVGIEVYGIIQTVLEWHCMGYL